MSRHLSEISEKQSSSLLNNIFSTILNLASLQIRNSLSLRQPNLHPFRSIRIVTEIRLWRINSHSEPCFRFLQRSLSFYYQRTFVMVRVRMILQYHGEGVR
jgi:hypothetical protein